MPGQAAPNSSGRHTGASNSSARSASALLNVSTACSSSSFALIMVGS
jgi:hypothetical protein